jgi:hypothetical protein
MSAVHSPLGDRRSLRRIAPAVPTPAPMLLLLLLACHPPYDPCQPYRLEPSTILYHPCGERRRPSTDALSKHCDATAIVPLDSVPAPCREAPGVHLNDPPDGKALERPTATALHTPR